MGKINVRVHHKDQAAEDHVHRLPDGSYTGGSLYKPNSDRSFPHTHLYQHNGKTVESCVAPLGSDHVHVTEEGTTSGPMPVRKDDAERRDYIGRVGSQWGVFSESGHLLGKHPTKEQAVAQLGAVEASKARAKDSNEESGMKMDADPVREALQKLQKLSGKSLVYLQARAQELKQQHAGMSLLEALQEMMKWYE